LSSCASLPISLGGRSGRHSVSTAPHISLQHQESQPILAETFFSGGVLDPGGRYHRAACRGKTAGKSALAGDLLDLLPEPLCLPRDWQFPELQLNPAFGVLASSRNWAKIRLAANPVCHDLHETTITRSAPARRGFSRRNQCLRAPIHPWLRSAHLWMG
jgi:hypothetical protein